MEDVVLLTLTESAAHFLCEIELVAALQVNLILSFSCIDRPGCQIGIPEDPHRVCPKAERSELSARQLH